MSAAGITVRAVAAASAAALEERQITAQEDLIAALLQVGGERRAIPILRELVARYPARERFCEQLMLALYNSGRRTEAIEVFHRARQWLGNELGLPPSHSLRDVYQAILVQQPDLLPQRPELARRSRGRC